ncbi:MAG: O-antigen ligase family protein [Elusimicrobia bacterium]|nr:O-antigen ligase family protein [Elusimicrobiota bacterium]
MLYASKNNSVIIAFVVSVLMVIAILSKFSFVFPIQSAIFLLSLLLFVYLINTNKFKINSYIVTSLLFFVMCCLSYIGADFKVNVRDYLVVLGSALLSGFSFSFLSLEWKKKVLFIPLFISLWLSMILFTRFVTNPQGFFYGDNFYETMALNINVIAGFLVLVYPLFFIFIKEQKNTKVFVAMMLFVLLAIFLTKCRIVILLSSISTLMFLFEYRKNKIVKILLILFTLLLISGICYISFLKFSYSSVNDRIIWWKTAFLIFKENILFGCGFGNYMVLFRTFRPELVLNTIFAHNIFMQLLAEVGLLGTLSFFALIFSFYNKIFKKIPEQKDVYFYCYIAISITSFLLVNLFDYGFFVPANMLIFFIIFSSAFDTVGEKRKLQKMSLIVSLVLYLLIFVLLAKPVIANNYYKKGIDLYVARHYKIAIEEFDKAIKFDKNNPEYYAQVSRAYFALYDKNREESGEKYADKSIEYLSKAISLNNYESQLKASLAAVYWNCDKQEEALKTIQEAIKYDKFNPYYEEYYYKIKNS